jgi:hypothetical protein
MRAVRLYHTTTIESADSIMRNGFYDGAALFIRLLGRYPKGRARPKLILTSSGKICFRYPPAVWFSSVPLIDDDLFDYNGYFKCDAEQQKFIAIDVHLPIRGIQSSARDKTWSGTQFWGPASIWNKFPRTRIELDDVIKLRLTSEPKKLQPMGQRLEQERRDPDDPYGDPFHNRVRKILASIQERGI